jgi:ferric-dicitrate binding protein FerR (iron transport regulator)
MKENREHLILSYFTGKLSAEERHDLEVWRNESDENRKIFDDFQLIWKTTGDNAPSIDFHSDQEWEKFASSAFQRKEGANRRTLFQEPWLKIAATILLLCVSSFVVFQIFFKTESFVIQTAENVKHTVLPDGSNVWLNAQSRLTYEDDFDNKRTVTLQGEAFFDVKKDSQHPFTIHAPDAEVKVLGTSFNVRAHEKETLTEVFVVTGKVSVKADDVDENILLTPGMTGVLSRNNHQLSSNTNDDVNRLAWKSRELVFRKAPLRTVIKTMSSYFRKEFRVGNDELLNCRFTGSFEDPSIDEVLESIDLALDLKANHQEDIYTLDGVGCKDN